MQTLTKLLGPFEEEGLKSENSVESFQDRQGMAKLLSHK